MIRKTIYIGSNCYIRTQRGQLKIEFQEVDKENASVPAEDLGVLILDAPQLTITRAILSELLKNNTAVIICNEKHLPSGMLLNLDGNNIQQQLFQHQIKATEAYKNNLWQQTIKAKITNQALLLESTGQSGKNLHFWAAKVKSGDPENTEGTAAAFYWKNIFNATDYIQKEKKEDLKTKIVDNFKRRRFGKAPNSLFNYGYAILRAVIARNLVASGLLCTLGIHHHNKYNAYALADDIMEPYRPYVDFLVRDLTEKYYDRSWNSPDFTLSPTLKQEILKIPVLDVKIGAKTHPLSIAARHTATSLAECFAKKKRKIEYPEFSV